MRWCLLLTIFILFTGCEYVNEVLGVSRPDERLANKITKQVALKLKKELDLYPCGSGATMMHEIKMLALSFNYYKPVDIEKGRELLVTAVSEFVDAVNANEKIRPYLSNYPFKPKNIEIRIFVQNLDGTIPNNGKLSVVVAIDGILEYEINDPKTGFLKTVYKETFEEALEKIKNQSRQKAS